MTRKQSKPDPQLQRRYISLGVVAVVLIAAVLVIIYVLPQEEGEEPALDDPFFAGEVPPVEEEPEGTLTPTPEPLFPEEIDAFAVVTRIEVRDNQTGQAFAARFIEDAQAAEAEPEAEEGEEAAVPPPAAWEFTEASDEFDTGLGPDVQRLTSALLPLPSLRPDSTLDDVPEDELADFGLEEPRYTVTFETDGGSEYSLLLGNTNPSSSHYYALLPGETSPIYLIPVFNLDPLVNFISDPPYLQPPPEDPAFGEEAFPGLEITLVPE